MALSIWETFVALFRGREQADEPSEFTPSPLDLSVRVGHGGADDEQVRELAELSAKAREIDDGPPR